MADHQPTHVQGHWNFLGCGQASDAQTILPLWGEYGPEIIGGGKVHRVIQAGVGSDSALEAFRRTIELAEKLDLQPALTSLDNLSGELRAG
ncbi:MAG TPA: hypothetical protein VMU94_04935 [Streptosporangiaceae bacterium]|nr:hypothetical protein [Streptosporangiaceae bacterium]